MEPDGYLIDAGDMTVLRSVLRRLYGDGTHITPDQRRDLANTMSVVLERAVPVQEDQVR